MRPAPAAPRQRLIAVATRLRPLARVQAEVVVQKIGQPRPKLQPVTAIVAATPVVVPYQGRDGDARCGGGD